MRPTVRLEPIIGHAMTREETAELSKVDIEVFGQIYRVYTTESRDCILEIARYVDSKMHSILGATPSVTTLDAATRESLAVRAALDIAEEYFLVRTALDKSEASVQPRLSNRERALTTTPNALMSVSCWP